MKRFKRIIPTILLMITILGGIFVPTISNATGNRTQISATHRFNNLLQRNGIDLTCIYVVHCLDEGGPAYCLNLELDGATENFSYVVNIDNLITDMNIWRTIINGYPYKTPEELGCATKEEAYLATRQAVYCAVYNRDPESYSALGGEAGERTLNALKNIVYTARNSNETKPSSTINIKAVDNMWQVDEKDENYMSKKFIGMAEATIQDYKIKLSGDLVEGMKLTDINNVETDKFTDREIFKIMIPITNVEKDGKIEIQAYGKVATRPIYYGISENPNLQNVAVSGGIYEDGTGSKTEYYFKNETKIVILKQDQETKKPLAGVKFQLLNGNKEAIYADLTTDENGTVTIENLLPGKYYIKELETQEGYEVYDKLIEVDAKLNEEIKVTVNNLANSEAPEIEKTNTELEVEQIKTQQEVKQEQTNYTKIKLPKTGM